MNTQLKVGDRVKIISGANMLEHNNQCGVIQQIGNTDMPLFTDYMAVKLDSGIVALCYTYEYDNRVVNIECKSYLGDTETVQIIGIEGIKSFFNHRTEVQTKSIYL